MRIAELEFNSDDKKTTVFEEGGKVISSYNRYNQNLHEEKKLIKLPYIDTTDMGTVFIYLIKESAILKKKERVCFARLLVKDLLDTNPHEINWLELECDKAIDEIKEP